MSWVTVLALSASTIGIVVTSGSVLLVLWQSRRRADNILVALHNVTVMLWGVTLCGLHIIGYFRGELNRLFFNAVTACLLANGIIFFALCVRSVNLWKAWWVRVGFIIGAALMCVTLHFMGTGEGFTHFGYSRGLVLFRPTPLGLTLGAITLAFGPANLAILYRYRAANPAKVRYLMMAGVATTIGTATRLIPPLAPYPLAILGAATCSVLLTRMILTEQLFDPIAQKNKQLERAVDALRASEASMAALLANPQNPIWSIDRSYRLTTVNATSIDIYKKTYGITLKPGMSVLEGLPPKDAAEWRAMYDRVLKGDQFSLDRGYGKTKDDLAVSIAMCPVRDSAGDVVGVVVFARDITSRVRYERALEQAKEAAEAANRAKSTFLAAMSHELRKPLSAILGYSELLLEDAEAADRAREADDLKRIMASGTHLLTLINSVLDLTKLEAERLELHITEFPIHPLVYELAKLIEPQAKKNNNAVNVECPDDIGVMRADATRVRQVLLNLLSNAAKFTKDGSVSLRAAAEGDRIVFRVADTGIGLSPGQVEGLFQPFTQASPDIAQTFGGTGLGLALSQKLCRRMGGDISVESALGQGSCFTASFPRQGT